jgi:uncharacterized protein (UPF0276 family)
MTPRVGLSLMLEPDFLKAAMPLLESGDVEVLEWSFDTAWGSSKAEAYEALLNDYSEAGWLLGHGVSYSLLSADSKDLQNDWLAKCRSEFQKRNYRHLTEHFGWMSGGDFHRGAPLPMPLTEETLELGVRNLKRLTEITDRPIGLENLAFAFSEADVRTQGEFIKALVSSVSGFLILDLHNLYCQKENFGISLDELVRTYPLELVKELHLSGGSWSETSLPSKVKIRRDTHDEAVPEEIIQFIPSVLALCPNVEAVIFERLGDTLLEEAKRDRFREDFHLIKSKVKNYHERI